MDHRHGLPVLTLLVLFRKEANVPVLTGTLQRNLPDGSVVSLYNYRVVRLWEQDVETFLSSGPSLLPLAPLTGIGEADLPVVVRRITERLNGEPHGRAFMLWGATYILMGLRYDDYVIEARLKGVWDMVEESVTFQKILKRGREEGARGTLLRLGHKRFGCDPDAAILAAIDAIHDLERIETLAVRVNDPDVRTWDDLLSLP
jgi:hypothetical protein